MSSRDRQFKFDLPGINFRSKKSQRIVLKHNGKTCAGKSLLRFSTGYAEMTFSPKLTYLLRDNWVTLNQLVTLYKYMKPVKR